MPKSTRPTIRTEILTIIGPKNLRQEDAARMVTDLTVRDIQFEIMVQHETSAGMQKVALSLRGIKDSQFTLSKRVLEPLNGSSQHAREVFCYSFTAYVYYDDPNKAAEADIVFTWQGVGGNYGHVDFLPSERARVGIPGDTPLG